MSEGEVVLSFIGGVVSIVTWVTFYRRFKARPVGHPVPGLAVMRLAPLAVAALIFVILRTVASFDVVNDYRYIAQYLALGMAWTGIGTGLFGYMGISVRDDVVERTNPAPVPAFTGGMLGVACCYVGGNIGDGPGSPVVIFAAFLATTALWFLWSMLERLTHISDAITIDRDVAAGNRLGGFLFGCGIILGRGVAGDWVSPAATIADFGRVAWPAVLLLLLAVVIERSAMPTPERPEPPVATLGMMPALVYAGLAAAYVAMLGLPE